jgi:hypothetical protein
MFLNDNHISIRRFRPDNTPFLFNAVRESINEPCAFMGLYKWCIAALLQLRCIGAAKRHPALAPVIG